MQGTIRKRDIVSHPVVTVRCFGWRVFLRCLVAGRDETFLDIVAPAAFSGGRPRSLPEMVTRSRQVELRARQIYLSFAERFPEGPVHEFFARLADQEQSHAELLDLCGKATTQEKWSNKELRRWGDVIPGLENRMEDFERAAPVIEHPPDALRMTIDLEASEINEVFLGVIGASRSEFVRAFGAFRSAELRHIAMIGRTIADLEPTLAPECRDLLVRFHLDTSA
jgi:hypothetical protein